MGIVSFVASGLSSVVLATTSFSTPLLLCWLIWSWLAVAVRLVVANIWCGSQVVVGCKAAVAPSLMLPLLDKIVGTVLPFVGWSSVELVALWSHLVDNKSLDACCKKCSFGRLSLVCCALACNVLLAGS